MTLKRVACIGLFLAFAGTAVGSPQDRLNQAGSPQGVNDSVPVFEKSTAPFNTADPLRAVAKHNLQARQPYPKRPVIKPERVLERLIVKFGDNVKMRPTTDGMVLSQNNYSTAVVNKLTHDLGVSFRSAFEQGPDVWNRVIERAEDYSGKMQIDLGGTMYVEGTMQNLEQAAIELNALDIVEYVQWYEDLRPSRGGPPGPTGACCIENLGEAVCSTIEIDECIVLGGAYQGDGTDCATGACGACCIGTQCRLRQEAICLAAGGIYDDDGAVCSDSTCGTGACCDYPMVGVCNNNVLRLECEDNGGTYQGDGVQCPPMGAPDPCAGMVTTGACCIGPNYTDDNACAQLERDDCIAFGGAYWGDDVACEFMPAGEDDMEPICPELEEECGAPQWGYCFQCEGTNSPYCTVDPTTQIDDMGDGGPYGPTPPDADYPPPGDAGECCEYVCEIDPFCCGDDDGTWDDLCAATATLNCFNIGQGFPDPTAICAGFTNDSCYEIHTNPGCNLESCCTTVCAIDAFCCTTYWDSDCVTLAIDGCDAMGGGPTPNYKFRQGYLTPGPYATLPDGTIPNCDGTPIIGYTGEGWNLDIPGEPWADHGADGIPDTDDFGEGDGWYNVGEPFSDVGLDGVAGSGDTGEGDGVWTEGQGLHFMGRRLLGLYNVDRFGQGVLTRGKTVTIGVIEWGWYGPEGFTDMNGNGIYNAGEPFIDINGNGSRDTGHEDLQKVVNEPGLTLFQDPAIDEPNHATACLSICGADDDGMGVSGVAPEAGLKFFALTSVETGPRQGAAWLAAIDGLDQGDVISCSWGPGSNLNNSPFDHSMITLGTNSGITTCVAAGNDCINLDDAPDLGDSGGIVVGACSPGFPWYRLAFSNYYAATANDNSRSNICHVRAWGTNIAAAGYGDLQAPAGNPYRSYTASFGGTSGATPQVAGLVACLQGLAKQFYGIPVAPQVIRSALGAPEGGDPPRFGRPSPTARLFGGFDPSQGICQLDLNSNLGPNWCGVYPQVADSFGSAAATLLNQSGVGFDESPLTELIYVLRGTYVYGNIFSIKNLDGVNWAVQSKYTTGSDRPRVGASAALDNAIGGSVVGPVSRATYIGIGQVTDTLVVAVADQDVPANILVEGAFTPPGNVTVSFVLTELYDWQSGDWVFQGILPFTAGGFPVTSGLAASGGAARFVNPNDNRVLVRIWTLGMGTGIAGQGGNGTVGLPDPQESPYTFLLDWLNVEVSGGIDQPSGGG